jgi:putative membrane protein
MRGLLKDISIIFLSIYLVSLVLTGIKIENLTSMLTLAIVLYFGNKILHPIVQVIFLPLNLLSLGIFSATSTLISLYFATLFVNGVTVTSFTFQGASLLGINIASISFNTILSFIAISVTIYFVEKVLFWLFSK